ncbi:MAG: hypothetical protein AAGG09_02350, partial [Pseudomonadota bacterium]
MRQIAARLAAIAICLSALAGAASAQSDNWPTKQFEVLNVVPAGHGRHPDHPNLVEDFAPELSRLARAIFGADTDLPGVLETVPLDPAQKLEIENYLTEVASLYDRWGFGAPKLSPIVTDANGRDAYRIYVLDGASMGPFVGLYGACAHDNLRANALALFENGQLSDFGAYLLAHELFHAVTWATPFFVCEDRSTRPGAWIYEGLADAVAADAVRLLRASNPDLHVKIAWGRRSYDQPLPAPLGFSETDKRVTDNQYGASSFWRYLAESYAKGGLAGPEPSAVDYRYVPQMLAQGPVTRDCNARGAVCASELRWADSYMRRFFGVPLRDPFARFLQAYMQYPEHRPGIGSGAEWRLQSLGECEPVHLNGANSAWGPINLTERLRSGRIERNAATCFIIRVSGFDPVNRLRVRAYDPTGRLPIQNLSAAMARPPQTLPKASLSVDEGGVPAQSAAWTFEVEEQTPSRLILTNMADDPGATTSLDGLLLEFTIVDEYARLGQSGFNTGEVADAINTPLDLEMKTFSAVVYPMGLDRPEDGIFIGPSGIANPCVLRIQAADEIGPGKAFAEHFQISLVTSGPIAPGAYPVLSYDEWMARAGGKRGNAQPANAVYATAGLYDMPDGDWSLRFETGTLTIETLTRDLIAGRILGVGHHRTHNVQTGRYEIEHSRTLAADFSIAVRGPVGPYREPDYPCIASLPLPLPEPGPEEERQGEKQRGDREAEAEREERSSRVAPKPETGDVVLRGDGIREQEPPDPPPLPQLTASDPDMRFDALRADGPRVVLRLPGATATRIELSGTELEATGVCDPRLP